MSGWALQLGRGYGTSRLTTRSSQLGGLVAWLGLRLGNKLGEKFGKRMEIAGGIILILIGVRILLAHLLGI
jgi:putative Mn2+ efflux pump MntP